MKLSYSEMKKKDHHLQGMMCLFETISAWVESSYMDLDNGAAAKELLSDAGAVSQETIREGYQWLQTKVAEVRQELLELHNSSFTSEETEDEHGRQDKGKGKKEGASGAAGGRPKGHSAAGVGT